MITAARLSLQALLVERDCRLDVVRVVANSLFETIVDGVLEVVLDRKVVRRESRVRQQALSSAVVLNCVVVGVFDVAGNVARDLG